MNYTKARALARSAGLKVMNVDARRIRVKAPSGASAWFQTSSKHLHSSLSWFAGQNTNGARHEDKGGDASEFSAVGQAWAQAQELKGD